MVEEKDADNFDKILNEISGRMFDVSYLLHDEIKQ